MSAVRKIMFNVWMMVVAFGSLPDVTAQTVYDSMRTKWYNFLTTPAAGVTDVSDAQSYWASMNKTAGRTYLWSNYTFGRSGDITNSYRRLGVMARAYCIPNAALFHNAAMLNDMISALQWLYANKYNENLPASALPNPANGSNVINWWDFQIGTPLELNDIVTLLYNDLSAMDKNNYMTVIDFFAHDFSQCYVSSCAGQFTGANRVWISSVIALRGVLVKDSSRIQYASNNLSPVFVYASDGDGFYRDGSFVQHGNFAYTGGYGISLLSIIAEELYLLHNTSFFPTDTNLSNVYNWVYDSYVPIIYKGGLMSNTMGREIARIDDQEMNTGRLAAEAVALLSALAPTVHKTRLQSLVKQWITETDQSVSSPARYKVLLDAIINDNTIAPSTEAGYAYRQFANMDRVVQRTPGYTFSISLYSDRMQNYESRTGIENIKGWHTGDGMSYLYTADTSQFNSHFWPTVDAYRLPGTTVVANTTVDAYKLNNKSWAGGAALLDRYGVTGWDYDPVSQLQSGKKSWFMFNGKIVCLGAGIITASGSGNVHTYIDQRKLKNDNSNVVTVNGTVLPVNMASPQTVSNAVWAHVTGNVANTAVGYYFPTPFTLNIDRKLNTGTWADWNIYQSATTRSNYYTTLWKNHGVSTSNTNSAANKYDYVLLPNYTVAQTQAYAASPDVDILQNTTTAQAARDKSANIIAANFFSNASTSLTVDGVSAYLISSKASSFIMQRSNDTLYVAVSDPTMLNTTSFNIAIKETAIAVIYKDPEITVNNLGTIHFTASVNATRGRSLKVAFKLTAPALPLQLVSLKANRIGNGVAVNWLTTQEKNVKGFDIQRSGNGVDFAFAGYTSAISGSNNHYSFVDKQAEAKGAAYYRIKMIDRDGSFVYSKVTAITSAAHDQLSVVQTGKGLLVKARSYHPTPVMATFNMYSLSGQLVFSKNVQLNTGLNSLDFPLYKAQGAYLLSMLQEGREVRSVKFIL
jgi:hyaluronate lyase